MNKREATVAANALKRAGWTIDYSAKTGRGAWSVVAHREDSGGQVGFSSRLEALTRIAVDATREADAAVVSLRGPEGW